MLLKNKSPRLISINVDAKTSFKLLPAGVAVDVPDEVCETKYVKALVENGSISVEGGSVKSDDPLADMTVADLKSYADTLEIEYDSKINKADLKALIETNQE